MTKSRILLQLDPDPQPSVFDAVVAVDAGADQLLRHGGVSPEQVEGLVHGAMFTRGPADLKNTALFIGGSDVAAAEELLSQTRKCFFGPFQVSVLLDPSGANTTAAAAVLCAADHVDLDGAEALVLAGTGPVGQRVARLLAHAGASVRIASRREDRAAEVCDRLAKQIPAASFRPCATADSEQLAVSLLGVQVVVAAGAAGIELLPSPIRENSPDLKVAVDLNAVPPVGIAGVEPTDAGVDRGGVTAYGAIGVGGRKMKIHKAALRQLFEANDQVLDAEEVFAIGRDFE